ncbi:MAG: putative Ig domain-containing protein [Nitrospirota bacterium]
MKSLAPLLSIIALVCGLVGCSGGGGSSGGGSASDFAVSTTAADFGVVGNAYTATLAVTGGTAPFTWTLFGGVLPAGLSLNPGTGVVSGIPTTVETPTAVFTVTDNTGKTATGSVLFAVHPRTDRASVTGSGAAGSGASSTPSMNSDGSLVAFISQSTNFVPGVSGSQIYVHNRQTNQIEVVSRDSDASVINEGGGTSSDPSISSDGRLVAFVSLSSNLVASVSGQQIYVRDRQTGHTTVVSKSSAGTIGDGTSNAPAISADGRYVAFASASTNLVFGVSGTQIYVHDRQTDQTTLISKDNNVTPVPGNGVSATPAISATGQFVAFASLSTNLGAAGGNQQIYLHDRLTGANGTTSLVSKDSVPTAGNGNSSTPSISGDGRFVAFVSGATNIVTGFSGQQVYVHDRNTGANGTNSLISRDNSGTPNAGNQNSSAPSISSDGRYVAFTSLATNLETGVSGQQIYRHDRNGPTTSLVSRDNTVSLVEGNASSEAPSISGNGAFIAFTSQASNLLAGGVAPSDIYIRALP